METAGQVPDFVWRELLALFRGLVVPAILVLALIGALVVMIFWRKGKLSFNDDKKGHPRERRANDVLVEKLLIQNDEAMNRFIEAYKEVGGAIQGSVNALRAVAGEVQAVIAKQDQAALLSQASFRGVHERLDRLVEGRTGTGG